MKNWLDMESKSTGHEKKYAYTSAASINYAMNSIRFHTDGMALVPIGFLKVAACSNTRCIGGSIPHQVGDDEWEAEQCQFCYEKKAMIATYKGESNE